MFRTSHPRRRHWSPARRRKTLLGGGAFVVAGGLALAGPLSAATAAGVDAVKVQTSQTVKANLTNTGEFDNGHVFTQVSVTGKGAVVVENPTSTKALRNLNGFGAPSTENGKTVYDVNVSGGTKKFRTVADFDKDLPVTVDITYRLDGKKISPDDLAGKSGRLAVSYTIKNTSAKPTEITYPDGHGKDVTETVRLVTPYVGQLAVTLPESFRQVGSDNNRADQAGDGHGGRIVTWTMVLFEPIGSVVQKFGYTANVTNAVIPPAHMQIVPVTPANHPELKFGQDGFSSGAQSGRDVTAAGVQIDVNLIKLQGGARKLLRGLIKLEDGASQLSGGLATGATQAIDGSQQLAEGTQQAADGSTELADGADQVAAGNAKLANGLNDLAGGAGQLSAGADQLATGFSDPTTDKDLTDGSQALASALGLISGGLHQLNNAQTGLPAARAGLQQLRFGIDHPAGALGPKDPGGLLQGLQQIAAGLSNPTCDPTLVPPSTTNPCGVKEGLAALDTGLTRIGAGLQQVHGGLSNPSCNPTLVPPSTTNPCGVREGVAAVKTGLDNGQAGLTTLSTAARDLYFSAALACPAGPGGIVLPPTTPGLTTDCRNASILFYGIEAPASATSPGGIRAQSQAGSAGLGLVLGGLDTKLIPGVDQLITGTTQAQAGLTAIRAGVDQLAAGSVAARDGVKNQILPGIDQLTAGLTTAVSAVGQLDAGAAQANSGAGDLADGIATAGGGAAQLSAGLKQLGAKAPEAVAGANQLATGSEQVAQGANDLSAGLNDQLAPGAEALATGLSALTPAVAGAQQLADGMSQAVDGDQQIVDGAGELSTRGSKKLIVAGNDTARTFARQYAIMQALDVKGAANNMPFGTPKGSTDNRGAYDISIAGVGHEGTGSTGRGLAALVILAVGAGAATLLRGRIA